MKKTATKPSQKPRQPKPSAAPTRIELLLERNGLAISQLQITLEMGKARGKKLAELRRRFELGDKLIAEIMAELDRHG